MAHPASPYDVEVNTTLSGLGLGNPLGCGTSARVIFVEPPEALGTQMWVLSVRALIIVTQLASLYVRCVTAVVAVGATGPEYTIADVCAKVPGRKRRAAIFIRNKWGGGGGLRGTSAIRGCECGESMPRRVPI